MTESCNKCKYWQVVMRTKGECTLYNHYAMAWDSCSDWEIYEVIE
jgi:hypothetical protein